MLKNLRPIFIENSKVPVWLSKVSPINISAITAFFIVFSRGRVGERLKRHETIHFQQYLETFVVGFLLIYLVDFIIGLVKYRSGREAYRRICFEQEAHLFDNSEGYLKTRQRYCWLFYRP